MLKNALEDGIKKHKDKIVTESKGNKGIDNEINRNKIKEDSGRSKIQTSDLADKNNRH